MYSAINRILPFLPALCALTLFPGCKTEDLTAPYITLDGANPYIIDIGGVYTEPGYVATDNVDGDITASVVSDTSEINTQLVGKYKVTYTVQDQAGNAGIRQRDVWVRATADSYAGWYTATEQCDSAQPPYQFRFEKVNSDTLAVYNLGNFAADTTLYYMLISGDLLDVLTISGYDLNDTIRTCTAQGTLTDGSKGAFQITISYTFDDLVNPVVICDDVALSQN